MDEWDDFLACATTTTTKEVPGEQEHDLNINVTLGEFEDNAEVMMQMARGESLSHLSSNGVWINSSSSDSMMTGVVKAPPSFVVKKRNFPSKQIPCSVPVANTLEDLRRALCGHPSLSYPLQQLKVSIGGDLQAYEVDSLGLFFYGSAGEIKIDSNVQDDFTKVIEIKNRLLGTSLRTSTVDYKGFVKAEASQQSDFLISLENYMILSNCLPPLGGKSNWIIPFYVDPVSGAIDLLSEPEVLPEFCSSELGLFFEFLSRNIQGHLLPESLITETEHCISIDNDLKILVKTTCPPVNISVNFRGSRHENIVPESAVNSLFSRQSNYLVEVDFENDLRVTGIKSFVPKFDAKNRSYLLFKALKTKLSKLPPSTRHFLIHHANQPFIKIFSSAPPSGSEELLPIHLDSLFKNK